MSVRLRWGPGIEAEPVFPPGATSAGLSDFMKRLRGRARPLLYDVGPARGTNIVSFAGQGLRVYVDAECDHRITGSAPDRLSMADESLDAALLWDLIDFLPSERAKPFLADLARAMKPGGLVFLLSSAARSDGPAPVFTYAVEDGSHLVARLLEGTLATRISRENRDILRLFEGFDNVSLHLLRSQMREIVLRRR